MAHGLHQILVLPLRNLKSLDPFLYLVPMPLRKPPTIMTSRNTTRSLKTFLVRETIILSLPEYIIKTLEDTESGIALVTLFQIVAAAYLELGSVHTNDLEEARLQLEHPVANLIRCSLVRVHGTLCFSCSQ